MEILEQRAGGSNLLLPQLRRQQEEQEEEEVRASLLHDTAATDRLVRGASRRSDS